MNEYWIYPAVKALREGKEISRRDAIRIAAAIGDENVLRDLFGDSLHQFDNFYPDELQPELTTFDAIETFLNRFPSSRQQGKSEQEQLDALVAASADYATMLEKDLLPPEPTQEPEETNKVEETDEKGGSGAELTESFARILIKNRNYSKALEIIQALSLNNPKKSIYFADQMRFLRKLIVIQQQNK